MEIANVLSAGITHSCYPNCGYTINDKLVLIAEVNPGEKLTVDFSTLFTGCDSLFHCNCGCNGCRINILGFDQLPVYVQDKYLVLGVVPAQILNDLDRYLISDSFIIDELF